MFYESSTIELAWETTVSKGPTFTNKNNYVKIKNASNKIHFLMMNG